jgi:hypothetical protein
MLSGHIAIGSDAQHEDEDAPPSNGSPLPSMYLDTSVPSYLTARWARDLATLRRQRITCLWWNGHRVRFDLFVSLRVRAEARAGNPEAATRRMEVISPLALIEPTEEAEKLAALILKETRLPDRARADAEHMGIAATAGMDYLLTWNCKHLANSDIRKKVTRTCKRSGFTAPELCTPEDILRRYRNERRPHT